MKKYFISFLLYLFTIGTILSQYKSPRVYIKDFQYLNNSIELSYRFENCLVNDKYSIILEAYTQNGKVIKAKSLTGDISNVSPDGEKKIRWTSNLDVDYLEENIYLKISAIKQQEISTSRSYLYSTIFPGAGHKQAGGTNKLYLGVVGYSGIAGAFLYNSKAADALDAYALEPDKAKSDALMNDAKKYRNISLTCAGVSLGMWALDYYLLSRTIKKTKTQKPVEIKIPTSGKDVLTSISQTKFISTRGLPPNLFARLSFSDANGNNILEANEEAEISIAITNQGKGEAYDLNVNVFKVKDSNVEIGKIKGIPKLMPNDSVIIGLKIKSGIDIKTEEIKFQINVTEKYGYDMDPAFLVLQSVGQKLPQLQFAGLEILDSGYGTASVLEDGKLQAGEMVKAKIIIQNTGEGASSNTIFNITTGDNNIYLRDNSGSIGLINPGEVKEIYVTISPNKRIISTESLPIFLDLKGDNDIGNISSFQLPVIIDQKPPAPNIVKIENNSEDISRNTARFEYNSKKFTTKNGDFINIKSVIPSANKIKNSIAVVFGVNKYENMAPAPYADNDAAIMKEYFEKVLGIEQVLMFSNEEVTISKMNKIFNPDYGELQKAVLKKETEVFVYFSGHGIPDKTGENTYLFPYDGVKQDLETFGYNTTKLYENLCKLDAKSVTVILDACFSGSSRKSVVIPEENLVAQKGVIIKRKRPWINNDSFTMINSSTGEETSLAYDESETGLFTYYFCAGLQGKADENGDKKISFGELKNYVSVKVIENSKKISGLQTPEFDGDENRVLVEY